MMRISILMFLFVFSQGYALASDWGELPNGFSGFSTESKIPGARAILSDITTGSGIMEVALFSVNPKCTGRGQVGGAYLYINQQLVEMNYICTDNGMSMYFAKSEKGKDYIYTEFKAKTEVCYSAKKDATGLCFSAIGFGEASSKLTKIILERNDAL